MKKAVAISLAVLLALSAVSPAYCGGPLRKLGRGVSNLITCPLEIYNRMAKTNKDIGPSMEWIVYGFISGFVMMGYRATVGAWEVISFPIPVPEKYEPILTDPEFFFGSGNKNDKKE